MYQNDLLFVWKWNVSIFASTIKKVMSLESSRVNVGNIYLLLTVCVILYIGRMLFKNKTETKSFETTETFADINMKICPYLVKKYFIVSHLRFLFRFYINSLGFVAHHAYLCIHSAMNIHSRAKLYFNLLCILST